MEVEISEQDLIRAVKKALSFCPRDFKITAHGINGIGIEILQQSGGATICPFSGVVTNIDGSTAFAFTSIGTISGVIPSNMFDGTPFVSLPFTSGVVQYVQAHASTDGFRITDIALQVSDTPAGSPGIEEDVAPASFDVDLYVIDTNGTAYKVIQCANLSANPFDALETDNPAPICAGSPVIKHFTWNILPVFP